MEKMAATSTSELVPNPIMEGRAETGAAAGSMFWRQQSSRLMKRLVIAFALLLSLAPRARPAEQSILARVTVYWGAEGNRQARWTGIPLRNGHCAVDPHKIPYGSKVILDGEELTAVDTGPAVVSRKAARSEGHTAEERNAVVVDRYFESKKQALAWARSHPKFIPIRVLPPPPAKQGKQ